MLLLCVVVRVATITQQCVIVISVVGIVGVNVNVADDCGVICIVVVDGDVVVFVCDMLCVLIMRLY